MKVKVRKKPGRLLQMFYLDPLTGLEVCRSAKTNDPREAERRAGEWERQLADGTEAKGISWQSFRTRFEIEHFPTISENSQSAYSVALNHFERVCGKPTALSHVSRQVLAKFRGVLVAEERPPASVANYIKHLRSALGWAKDAGLIANVPKIKLPKIPTGGAARGRAITPDEFTAMKAAARKKFPRFADDLIRRMEVLFIGGLRLEEAHKLSWDAGPVLVDLDSGKYPRLLIEPAGQKSREYQVYPLTPDFARYLRETPAEKRHGLVCPVVIERSPAKLSTVGKRISAVGREAKIGTKGEKFASSHDLRRSFGRRWALKVHPLVLQRLMRHKKLDTTLAFYVDLQSDELAEQLWKLE